MSFVRAQEAGLAGMADEGLLSWAAERGRVVGTHDVNTLVGEAHRWIAAPRPMAGVIVVPWEAPIGRAVEELVVLAGAGQREDFASRVYWTGA